MANGKTIGEMNGRWAMAFKVLFVLAPMFFAAQTMFLGWMATEIITLKTEIAVIKVSLPKTIPPTWFLEEVKDIKNRVRDLEHPKGDG